MTNWRSSLDKTKPVPLCSVVDQILFIITFFIALNLPSFLYSYSSLSERLVAGLRPSNCQLRKHFVEFLFSSPKFTLQQVFNPCNKPLSSHLTSILCSIIILLYLLVKFNFSTYCHDTMKASRNNHQQVNQFKFFP